MKKFVSLVMVLVFALCCFASCSQKPEKAIIGTWIGTKDLLLTELEYTYTFNEDGTGVMSTPDSDLGLSMTYTIEEDTLTIVSDISGFTNTSTYTMTIADDTLTLIDGSDSIVLTRQVEEN